MATYLRFVERFAKLILVALAAITLCLGASLSRLSNDSNPYLLSEEHPARRTILDMQKEFTGTYDSVILALHNREGVFNPVTLAAIQELTESSRRVTLANEDDFRQLGQIVERYGARSPELGALAQGVLENGFEPNDFFMAEQLASVAKPLDLPQAEQSFLTFLPRRLNPIKDVAGMAATENMLMRDGALVVRPSLRDKDMEPRMVRDEVMNNELMVNGIVSKDEKVALVTVELFIKQEDAEGQLRAYNAFASILDEYRDKHPEFKDEVHIAGVPIFMAEQKKIIDHDMATLFPLVILIVGAILVVFFRKTLGVLLPLLNVMMCSIWTLGIMAVTHSPLDLVTSVLPVFLVTICGADAIHIMSEYYHQRGQGLSSKAAMRETMRVMVSPVVLTTATTVAGFLLSTATNISSIRSFGIFMSVGLVAAQIISLLLIPAWLSLVDAKHVVTPSGAPRRELLGPMLERFFGALIRRRRPVLLGFSLLLAGAGYMASKINVEDAGAEYFARNNPFRMADDFVNEHMAGTSPGWITVQGAGPGDVLDVETVAFIDRLDRFLAEQKYVTYSYSLAKYVKRMHLVMNDMDLAYDRVPEKIERVRGVDPETNIASTESVSGDDIVSQSVLMYENGGGSDLTNVLSSDFSKAVTMFVMNSTRASDYKELLANLNRWLDVNKPSGTQILIGGTPVIWSGVLDEIIKGQLASLVLALSAVTLMLTIWMRSINLGILASLPLAATMVFYYGTMSALDMDLNIGTALISFLVVGIVDYSVHYLHRIQDQIAAGETLDNAVLYAIRHSGKSIVFNVLVFSLGFVALTASEFTPIVQLGLLVALALTISGFMSLFLISMLAPTFISVGPTLATAKHATAME